MKHEWQLSRETETPAFTGRIDEMESEKSSEMSAEERQTQKLKAMIKAEATTFFNTFIQTPHGKREFASWMWKKVDSFMPGSNLQTQSVVHHGVSATELKTMMEQLKRDGILPSQLLFGSSLQSTEDGDSNVSVCKATIYSHLLGR